MRTRIRSLLKLMMALVMMITLAACDKLPNNIVPGNDKPEEEVLTVPDFTGLTREDAEACLDKMGDFELDEKDLGKVAGGVACAIVR